jgi:cytoskeleton protein RodZ
MPERGLPAGALILLGLILVGGAYIGWYRLSGEGRLPAESVPPVPDRLAALIAAPVPVPVPVPATAERNAPAVAVPAPPAPPPAEDIGLFEPRQAAAESPRLQPQPTPPAPSPFEEMRVTSIPGGTATTAIAMPVPSPMRQPEPAEPQGALPGANPDGARVVLRATGDTWVQVKERGGDVLFTKVMRAGEVYPVPDRGNLILNTGNAGRIDILVDGVEAPPIGGPGSVRKEVPLVADLLKAGPVVPVSGRR